MSCADNRIGNKHIRKKETKKQLLVFIAAPRKIIYNFKKGYKIGCPERGLGIIGNVCGLIVHFDLVGQKSQ